MSELIEVKLCHQNDLADNSMKEFVINAESLDPSKPAKVLLVKQDNKFHAIGSKCSHYGVPLANGVLYKGRVRCFAHGACFNVETGDIEDYPGPDCLPKYDVSVDEATGDVLLRTTADKLYSNKRVSETKPRLNRPFSSTHGTESTSSISSNRPSSANPTISRQISTRTPKCLIIGSGSAGLTCADTLREAGFGSNLTIITNENVPPYDRPKLSKALNVKIEGVALRDEEYYRKHQINFVMNQNVEKIDFEKKLVYCSSDRTFDYDRLIIATGLRAFSAPKSTPGHDLKGIFTLRTLEDANKMVNYFDSINTDANRKLNVVTIGSSFIAMETICCFTEKSNAVVLSRTRPYETAFGYLVSDKVKKLHESKGLKFHIDPVLNVEEYIESPERPGSVGSLRLQDGSVWPVDLCLVATGGQPVTDFLRNSPVKMTLNNYVIVDKHMRTNVPNVYAAGDIATFPRACLPGLEFTQNKSNEKLDNVNIAHWGVAGSQGRAAGLAIVNENQDLSKQDGFKVVPFFWSVQYNKMMRFAGYNHKFDVIVFHEDKTKQNEYKFAAFFLLDNKCVAVCTLDWDPVCALFGEALYNKIVIKREHIENDPMDIKKLLE